MEITSNLNPFWLWLYKYMESVIVVTFEHINKLNTGSGLEVQRAQNMEGGGGTIRESEGIS